MDGIIILDFGLIVHVLRQPGPISAHTVIKTFVELMRRIGASTL